MSESTYPSVKDLTLEEKASLTSGGDAWHLQGVEAKGIPGYMITDGPHGLRKSLASSTGETDLDDSVPATCFPPAAGLSSSWNPELIHKVGEAMAEECIQEKVAVILGPGVNIKRNPLGGRCFEYWSEDPYLAGHEAIGIVEGVQSKGVGTSLKHFAANNQETDRLRVDARISPRALREIYFPAFEHIVKVGRTCWQDALPVTLGQEFSGFASAIRRQARALKALRPGCFELIMGGNAVGTGLGAQPGYMEAFYKAISAELGESVRPNPNLFDGFQNSDFILTVSGAVKTIAATLSKICKDLRLMSSGPRAGWMEINLPACAPGSSIMPGKINPTVPEMVIQIGHQVCGNDVAITMAIDEGELDLNVWDATFYKCLFENLQLVGEEIVILRRDCVEGITANESRCKEEAESSIALSTVVAATFGYPQGVEVAHYCEKHRCNVKDAVVAMELMTQEQAEILVDPSLMANPEKMAPIVARFKKELGILI